MYNIPHGIDEKWGYALTMARDNYAKETELIPNLQPLRNGDSVIGPDGFYYMGGVNNGEGLDSEQSGRLEQILDEDEPTAGDNDDSDDIFVWFSDEEFVGGSDNDEW
ncbi:hypothetical protein B0H13DRAFT_1862403 [Mycena leptocephala]|nr:hypothetical protein B0H13DRAFT_1862403 [Mycena leptocephala]